MPGERVNEPRCPSVHHHGLLLPPGTSFIHTPERTADLEGAHVALSKDHDVRRGTL